MFTVTKRRDPARPMCAPSAIEPLEHRTLLSAALVRTGGTLTVTGTSGPDRIRIDAPRGAAPRQLRISVNGTVYTPNMRKPTTRIVIRTAGGDDRLRITERLKYWGWPNLAISADLGAGDDYANIAGRTADGVKVNGGAGDDELHGHALLVGGAGSDLLDGDAVSYADRDAGVRVTADGVDDDGAVGEHDNVMATTRTITGGAGDDYLALGTPLNGGTVHGLAGNDTLVGSAFDDEFFAEPGADTYRGRDGNDAAGYSGRFAAVRVTLNGLADDGAANEHDDVGGDIERLIGGNGDDYLKGNGRNNRLAGNRGNDTLLGLGGNDELVDGVNYADAHGNTPDEHDQLFGGDGDDFFIAWGFGPNDLYDGGADTAAASTLPNDISASILNVERFDRTIWPV